MPLIQTTFLEQIVKAVKDIDNGNVPEEVWSKIGEYLRLSNEQIQRLLPKYYYGIKWDELTRMHFRIQSDSLFLSDVWKKNTISATTSTTHTTMLSRTSNLF